MGNVENRDPLFPQAQNRGGDQAGFLRFQRRGGFIEYHQLCRAVDQRSGDLHQLAFGEAEVADQAAGMNIQLPAVAEKRPGGRVHSPPVQRAPAGAVLLAEKHRFRHRKVRD